MIIYETNNKLYLKNENYYKEISIKNGKVLFSDNNETIYESQFPKNFNKYSLDEYLNKSKKEKEKSKII